MGFHFSAYGVVQSQRVSRLVVRGLGLSLLHHSPPALRILQHGAGAKHIPIEGLVVMIGLKDRGLQQSHSLVALLVHVLAPVAVVGDLKAHQRDGGDEVFDPRHFLTEVLSDESS